MALLLSVRSWLHGPAFLSFGAPPLLRTPLILLDHRGVGAILIHRMIVHTFTPFLMLGMLLASSAAWDISTHPSTLRRSITSFRKAFTSTLFISLTVSHSLSFISTGIEHTSVLSGWPYNVLSRQDTFESRGVHC